MAVADFDARIARGAADRNDRGLGVIGPLLDVIAFCALLAAGESMTASHLTAFAAGTFAYWLLRGRVLSRAAAQPPGRTYLRLGVVTLMALFLRGGVLALLTQRWDCPAPLAIVAAVAAGLAVTLPGYSYALWGARGRTQPTAFAYGLIAFAVLLRLIYAGSVELLPEETYYWNYSQHLDFGYLDHPPMVAWLIRIGTFAFGQSEFGVRAGALCCGIVTSLFIYKLARNIFGEAGALAALLLTQSLPFFFLSGMLMTPDAPLTAAWAASVYFLERALIAQRPGAWWRAGVCLGLGMISKYTIALLIPVTMAFMVWDKAARAWWRRGAPYVAALLAGLVFMPVILWNFQHDWVSFAFQTSRRLAEPPRFALPRLIASLLVLMTPTGVAAVAYALITARGGGGWAGDSAKGGGFGGGGGGAAGGAPGDAARGYRLLVLAILVPLSVFVIFSLRHEVKLDWTGASWTAALPIMGFTVIATSGVSGFAARLRAAWAPTLVTMLLLYGALLHYLVLGFPGLGYGKHIEVVPVGWRDLSAHISDTAAALRKDSGADVLIVGMDRYAIASELAFYGERHAHSRVETANSNLFEGMGLMYGQWLPPKLQEHRNLLLVAWDPTELEGPSIAAHAARLGPVEDDVLMRDGRIIRHYYHRIAYDYRSIPGP